MKFEEIYVTNKEVEDFLFNQLIRRGHSVAEEELGVLSDIIFDFLVHKRLIEEE